MAGPWERYQQQSSGPWSRYQSGRQDTPQAVREGENSLGYDLLHSAGAGLRSGLEMTAGALGDVAGLNKQGASWLAQKLGASPEAAGTIGDVASMAAGGPALAAATTVAPTTQDVQSVTDPLMGESYQPQSTAGKYAKTAAEFLPATAFGRGNLARRLIGQSLLPGVASEAAGQATEGTAAEPYARTGAALLTGALPGGTARMVAPQVSAERQAMIRALMDEGVDLTAGQMTGGKRLRNIEAELGGSRGQQMMENQGEQFTRAALKRAGIDASRATPEVIDQAFTRIGNEFDALAAKTRVPLDQKLQNDMLQTVTDYQATAATPAPVVERMMNRAAELAKNGSLEGEAYKNLRSEIGKFSRSSDGPTKQALREMQEDLDDAVERAMPKDTVERWQKARNQYRNMLVLEQAATGAGENAAAGLISPSALRNATVQKQGRRNYARGQGDFAELARAGEGIMKPLPDSGTAGRINAQQIGTNPLSLLGIGTGAAAGGPVGAIAGALAARAAPAAIGRAALSGPMRNAVARRLLQQGGGGAGALPPALIQALIGAQSGRDQ